MDSTIIEKKKLYDTLLSFPPFFTFEFQIFIVFKNMNNQEESK
jgi:hypothetical protein